MRLLYSLFAGAIALCGCRNGEPHKTNPANTIVKATDIVSPLRTHLRDTEVIQGNFVLFLRPDSIRFDSYLAEGDEIYEGDSDFGFAIQATLDSMALVKKYQGIAASTTDKRYISILDCKQCPLVIDRDTLDYGLLLTGKDREVHVSDNIHSVNYLPDVDKYFGLRN